MTYLDLKKNLLINASKLLTFRNQNISLGNILTEVQMPFFCQKLIINSFVLELFEANCIKISGKVL